MKGQLFAEPTAYRLEIVEPIPWPRGGLSEVPLPFRDGGLLAPEGPRPLSPGERALFDRLVGYVEELIASCGGRVLDLEVSVTAAPPKHAAVRIVAGMTNRARGFLDPARLERRVSGLCCGPVIAYREGGLTWYQCGNCARTFCPECLAPDLVSQQAEDDSGESGTAADAWSLQCGACAYIV